MDRVWLERELAAGRSIESIAREVGRDPTTVSYWVRKLGLRSAYSHRHAPRGGIEREVLEGLVMDGLSSREFAERLELSQSTVRHWLQRHGLKTQRATRVTPTDGRTGVCPVHGATTFVVRADGLWRCLICRSEAVSRSRRKAKRILVEEAGGGCVICGYRRTVAALHFHHLDRDAKRFSLGSRGLARSLDRLREEAAKCVLLCANCHVEVEMGIATLPERTGE